MSENGHPFQSLKRIRELLRIRAGDLAQSIGIQTDTYYRVERGERGLSFEKAMALAEHLAIDARMFMRPLTDDEQVGLLQRQIHAIKPPQPKADADVDSKRIKAFDVLGAPGKPYDAATHIWSDRARMVLDRDREHPTKGLRNAARCTSRDGDTALVVLHAKEPYYPLPGDVEAKIRDRAIDVMLAAAPVPAQAQEAPAQREQEPLPPSSDPDVIEDLMNEWGGADGEA